MDARSEEIDFFATLPDEIKLLIFAYLSPRELAVIMRVCAHNNQLANDRTLWMNILKEHLKSTYSPNPDEELKEIAHSVQNFAKEEDTLVLVLAACYKANLNGAKLILQTPLLMDKLTDPADLERLGVAHEEAARIILQTPELMEKIIGKPRTENNPFDVDEKPITTFLVERPLDYLVNIISAHETLAQEFLNSKEATTNSLKAWINSEEKFQYLINGGLVYGQISDEKSMEKLANHFLERLIAKIEWRRDHAVSQESETKPISVTDRMGFWSPAPASNDDSDDELINSIQSQNKQRK